MRDAERLRGVTAALPGSGVEDGGKSAAEPLTFTCVTELRLRGGVTREGDVLHFESADGGRRLSIDTRTRTITEAALVQVRSGHLRARGWSSCV